MDYFVEIVQFKTLFFSHSHSQWLSYTRLTFNSTRICLEIIVVWLMRIEFVRLLSFFEIFLSFVATNLWTAFSLTLFLSVSFFLLTIALFVFWIRSLWRSIILHELMLTWINMLHVDIGFHFIHYTLRSLDESLLTLNTSLICLYMCIGYIALSLRCLVLHENENLLYKRN